MKRGVLGALPVILALGWTHPVAALPIPRVDLPEGLSLSYEPPEPSLLPVLRTGTVGLDYRIGQWAGGFSVATSQVEDPAAQIGSFRPFYDPQLTLSWAPIETSWLTIGAGGVIATEIGMSGLRIWRSGAGLCASLHCETLWAGQRWRLFFDPSVTLALRLPNHSIGTGGGTGFVAGVGVNQTFEVMFSPMFQSGLLLNTIITGIRAKL